MLFRSRAASRLFRRGGAAARERDDYYDVLDYTVFYPARQLFDLPRHGRALARQPKQALNVTPLDEIQDSTWFSNRIGIRDIGAEDLRLGPNAPQGPDPRGPWTIVRAKTQGVTPGFNVRDANGQVWVIKFDIPGYAGMASAAGVISGRILHTAGYHVPDDRILVFARAELEVGADVMIRFENEEDERQIGRAHV